MVCCYGKTNYIFLMMIQYYTHDCWMRYTARFQLLTLGEQKHSN